jgi:hypothetical protein
VSWLLPAFVAPYLLRRQIARISFISSLPLLASQKRIYLMAPVNFPAFPEPQTPLPAKSLEREATRSLTNATTKRKVKTSSSRAIIATPELHPQTLLPLFRPSFTPQHEPDPVRHPYSFFLSLDPQQRAVYLFDKVQNTRKHMSLPPAPLDHAPKAPWKCAWMAGEDAGVDVEYMITTPGSAPKPVRITANSAEIENVVLSAARCVEREILAHKMEADIHGFAPYDWTPEDMGLPSWRAQIRRCRTAEEVEAASKQVTAARKRVDKLITDLRNKKLVILETDVAALTDRMKECKIHVQGTADVEVELKKLVEGFRREAGEVSLEEWSTVSELLEKGKKRMGF